MSLRKCIALLVITMAASQPSNGQLAAEVAADRDATLYENATGSVANGSGQYLFSGRTGQNLGRRRGLIWFDLAPVLPAGSMVDSVVVTLHMSKTASGTRAVSLHRVDRDWGEGASNAGGEEGSGTSAVSGDATWTNQFFGGTEWNQPGGDFEAVASATRQVDGVGSYSWRGSGLADDVRSWLSGSAENFGWALVGDESTARTAKRFDSRESPNQADRPTLTVYYGIPTAIEDLLPVADKFILYPNPVNRGDQVRFSPGLEPVRVSVYDLLGRRVFQEVVPGDWPKWDTSRLSPGVYLVTIGLSSSAQILTVR